MKTLSTFVWFVWFSWLVWFCGVLGLQSGCHRNCELDRPVQVQVLAGASEVLNADVDGTPWALNLWLVELKSDQGLEGLDAKAAIAAERAGEGSPFGEDYVKSHDRTIFHGEKKAWQIELSPETTHVVAIADFRQIVGDAWRGVYELPPNYPEQRCKAERKRKRKRRTLQQESAPCIYLFFDSHEVRGGRYRPAGLSRDGFGESMICAPVVDLDAEKRKKRKKRKKRRKERKKLKPPSLRAPSTPSAPSAPSAPVKPTVPVPR